MSGHDCLGLSSCLDHPRWHVWRAWPGTWFVWEPCGQAMLTRGLYDTFAEAITEATRLAREEAAR